VDDFPDRIRAQLAAHRPDVIAEWNARPAAVLIPLYREDGEWRVLFTERTHTVEDHKGQVAFPGGRVDDGDASRVDTALRETEEEIGLKRADVAVLGQLDELLTVTQYRVTPVVGVFPWPYPFVLSAHELSEVFGVPLMGKLADGYLAEALPASTARVLERVEQQFPGYITRAQSAANLAELELTETPQHGTPLVPNCESVPAAVRDLRPPLGASVEACEQALAGTSHRSETES